MVLSALRIASSVSIYLTYSITVSALIVTSAIQAAAQTLGPDLISSCHAPQVTKEQAFAMLPPDAPEITIAEGKAVAFERECYLPGGCAGLWTEATQDLTLVDSFIFPQPTLESLISDAIKLNVSKVNDRALIKLQWDTPVYTFDSISRFGESIPVNVSPVKSVTSIVAQPIKFGGFVSTAISVEGTDTHRRLYIGERSLDEDWSQDFVEVDLEGIVSEDGCIYFSSGSMTTKPNALGRYTEYVVMIKTKTL